MEFCFWNIFLLQHFSVFESDIQHLWVQERKNLGSRRALLRERVSAIIIDLMKKEKEGLATRF
jgi:hypothetical protein